MKTIKTTILIWLTCLSSVSFAQKETNNPSNRPNIIFIMADDHTAQSWGIYGGILKNYAKTENIRRMAKNGAVLDNAFCTNSLCTPSRASIMTGQYSNVNGVYTLEDALDPERPNIAKELQKSGYQTALIGKWHLKKQPTGFDYFKVMDNQGIYFNPTFKTKEDWKDDGQTTGKVDKGYNTDLVTDFSIDWIKKRDQKKPFFLMTHFKATHEPWEYPDRYKDLYKNVEIPYPGSILDFGPEANGRTFKGQQLEDLENRWELYQKHPDTYWTSYPGMPFSINGLDSIQARKKIYQKFVKDYLRCAAAIDDNIGRILDHLEQTGLAKNTVVIYTSDQGYFLGEHGFFDKRTMYEESLRMPFVICYPKEIKGGSRFNQFVLNIDFPALFADYAGIPKPSFIQGKSFRPILEGKTIKNWRKYAYYRYWEHLQILPAHFGIRSDRYKLIFYYGSLLDMTGGNKQPTTPAWEFYDLKNDPKELHNAYHDEKYQQLISQMKVELLKQKQLAGDNDANRPAMKEIMSKYWNK
ncbi:sulfatase [Pedobacter sp. HMWF019]|uniref:sulfatase family protein n=1 Tax=Pedobacter sp. HMWF019 TaxID=2056856 RepID=UPI0018EE8329|nr:sulfatase [Pedobacter sp. HMWF019]